MYAASGFLILCRWPSCALAKGSIKLVSIKELYYDARPTKSQDLLNMFRALLCPSSGARQTAVAASGFRMNVEVEVFSADHG